jgi:predicted lipoprotein with Yx(FWY)xxD motif
MGMGATATPTMGMGMGATATPTMGMGKGATATPTMGMGKKSALIHTATVKISGKKVQVLTNSKGFVLYYYMKDTMMTSACTGGCAMSWPAVVAPKGTMTVSSSVMLPHKLSIHKTANGNQVFYDDHPLYTYKGDMMAGQFTGRGMDNAWYLAGVNL